MNKPTQPAEPGKKFFDVVPPHKTAASPTSRPIVTVNQPEQPDPMLMAADNKPPEPAKIPIHSESADKSVTQAEPTRELAPDSKPVKPEAPPKELAISDTGELSSTVPLVPDTPAVTAGLITPDTVGPTEPSKIVVARHRHSITFWRRTWFILTLLIIVIALVDMLLDAGVLKTTTTNNIPHTHFFGHRP
ncbi:MAG TPA: hypothetical protein VMR28_00530 [Candidatus Saccharimonadales bacterium]|nr:hypothetical protein [Candidatus Saccharimonadales bacterium]